MKGDFSRRTFVPAKHYSGVLLQQGRVAVDADWNEQQAIQQRRIELEALDVIGGCGAPEDAPGFAISTPDGQRLLIGAGRFYVDGILCENDQDIDFTQQPDLPLPDPTDLRGQPDPRDIRARLAAAKTTTAIVYLDVWRRHLTALDDPLIREVALGGPDTATRLKTVWQVKILPVTTQTSDRNTLDGLLARRAQLQAQLAQFQQAGGNPGAADRIRQELASIAQSLDGLSISEPCGAAYPEWDQLTTPSTGTLNARTTPSGSADDPCILPPSAGYQRLENQLYRVEVHQGGALGTATFKWSRENGSVAVAIESGGGTKIVVHDVGPDDDLGFKPNQWVEIVDDRTELNGLPGQLVQIDTIAAPKREITLQTSLSRTIDPAYHPKLRRWDQSGSSASANGIPTASGWLDLEGGIQVTFANGNYNVGDYWLIPARTATGEIEWPPYAVPNTSPIPQPPSSVEHHYCRLGLVENTSGTLSVQDCRTIFPPLTHPARPAMHVTGVNWRNDDLYGLRQLLDTGPEGGLQVQLDSAPDPVSVSDATMIVTLEAPVFLGNNVPLTLIEVSYILEGSVAVDPSRPNRIRWTWQPGKSRIVGNLGAVAMGPALAQGMASAVASPPQSPPIPPSDAITSRVSALPPMTALSAAAAQPAATREIAPSIPTGAAGQPVTGPAGAASAGAAAAATYGGGPDWLQFFLRSIELSERLYQRGPRIRVTLKGRNLWRQRPQAKIAGAQPSAARGQLAGGLVSRALAMPAAAIGGLAAGAGSVRGVGGVGASGTLGTSGATGGSAQSGAAQQGNKDQFFYLDGQVFGVPALRSDNRTPCTALALPSGDSARASDFESWFYLVLETPQQQVVLQSLTVSDPTPIQGASVKVTATISQAAPSPNGSTITLTYQDTAPTWVLNPVYPTLLPSGGGNTLPGHLTVPAGQTSVSFTVTTNPKAEWYQTGTITATLGQSKSAGVTITPVIQ